MHLERRTWNDFYGEIHVPTAGMDARDTDASEALLALCRQAGWHYRLEPPGEGMGVRCTLTAQGPLDFFAPYACRQTYTYVGSPATPLAAVIRGAIQMALSDLTRNAGAFRNQYLTSSPRSSEGSPALIL